MTIDNAALTGREFLEHNTAASLLSKLAPRVKDYDQFQYEKLRKAIAGYSDDTLHKITTIALNNIDFAWEIECYLYTEHADETYLNDWITMVSIDNDLDEFSAAILVGLTQYGNLEQATGRYPDERKNQVVAITRATRHLVKMRHGVMTHPNLDMELMKYIEGKELRNLFTNGGDPAPVADIIIERGITDPDQIAALVDTMSDTPNSITTGTL